jgi:chemotaxis protein histidine kinase CheA
MGISGGAILADGKVGLILDAHGLFEYYSSYYESDVLPTASESFPRT